MLAQARREAKAVAVKTQQRWDDIEYAVEGLPAKDASVRKDTAFELCKLLSSSHASQEILYFDGGSLVRKMATGTARLISLASNSKKSIKVSDREKAYEATILACLALAKVYSHEDEWAGLLEMHLDLEPLVPSMNCLLQLAKCSIETIKPTSGKLNSKDLLEGVSNIEKLGWDENRLNQSIEPEAAALLALSKAAKLHVLFLKRTKWLEADQSNLIELIHTVRGGLIQSLLKEDDDLKFERLLCAWSDVVESYSSIVKLSKVFVDEKHEILLTELSKASRTLMEEFIETTKQPKRDLKPVVVPCLLSMLRILTNLTHDNSVGCNAMNGDGLKHAMQMFEMSLDSQGTPIRVKESDSQRNHMFAGLNLDGNEKEIGKDVVQKTLFDIRLMLLGVLTNTVETHPQNRVFLAPNCRKLIRFFNSFVPQAALAQLEQAPNQVIEFGWTAEDLITCSYVCLLFGCLMRENRSNQIAIKALLPGKSLAVIIQVLQAFLVFQKDARVLSNETEAKIMEIITEIREIELGVEKHVRVDDLEDESDDEEEEPHGNKKRKVTIFEVPPTISSHEKKRRKVSLLTSSSSTASSIQVNSRSSQKMMVKNKEMKKKKAPKTSALVSLDDVMG